MANQIRDYAEALKDRLEAALGLSLPYNYRLSLAYSKTWTADEYGHRHKFAAQASEKETQKRIIF